MTKDHNVPDQTKPADAVNSHEILRANHFERLNAYRQSYEYSEFVRRIGAVPPEGDPPSLLGRRWAIDQAIFDEFLEMLPPLRWTGDSFYFPEFCFDDITTRFTKSGGACFCEFARFPARHPVIATPWGPSQHSTTYAPGIVLHSTAGHGGFHLTAERIAELPEPLRDFIPFGGPQQGPGRWFEEDCDWSVVALGFPQYFSEDALRAAHATLKGYRPETYAAFLDSQPRAQVSNSKFRPDRSERSR